MKPEEFDFVAFNSTNLPDGYPSRFSADSYVSEPFSPAYDDRRKACLEFFSRNPARPTVKGFIYELARLATSAGNINWYAIEGALTYVEQRIDCADFVLLGILRLVFQFGQHGMRPRRVSQNHEGAMNCAPTDSSEKKIPDRIVRRARDVMLGFKYWPDEPGQDSMCTWTENHQVIFSTCEYLAGMLFPDETFRNSGATGREKTKRARRRLLKWMELRFRTGFNEWLSNVYYDEDIAALVTLADFCDDPLLVRGARCALDLLFYDMSLNSFKGTFGCTHGRSYEREKKSGLEESTADTQKLMFGMGVFGSEDSMSAVHLALSRNYRLPKVIYDIASDYSKQEMTSKQRAGIRIAEAPRWGLGFEGLDDGMTLLSFEAYVHPKTFALFIRLLEAYRWWDNEFFVAFKKMRKMLTMLREISMTRPVAWLLRKDVSRNMREEVHTVTYKTPDYMLSAALDYRKGFGGDQQHVWQATLSEEAVCFTTHPGSFAERSPDYWTGSGFLPRVAMHKNVLVAVYRISSMPGLYMRNKHDFTHAYFPKSKFDEVAEKNGWVFGRKDRGYIALYSRNKYYWQKEGTDREAEIIAAGKENIWLCEMGREETSGGFSDFQKSVAAAELSFNGLGVQYHSPSVGAVEFGWSGNFLVAEEEIPLRNCLRYDNPYSQTAFDPKVVEIRKDSEWLRLELDNLERSCSSTV
ncbi:hypothetical protein HZA56_05480 [Candidatus Poribacteria bacterium]|nr:hypothetical protein [Candidatus Poribacteria bacterium]